MCQSTQIFDHAMDFHDAMTKDCSKYACEKDDWYQEVNKIKSLSNNQEKSKNYYVENCFACNFSAACNIPTVSFQLPDARNSVQSVNNYKQQNKGMVLPADSITLKEQ